MPLARHRGPLGLLAAFALAGGPTPDAVADTVTLKNGLVYRGTVDRDNTIVQVHDGLKRVILRESKIDRIDSDASYRNLEEFELVQPMEVHTGQMPRFVLAAEATPWNEFGRRTFRYLGDRSSRPVTMQQAINRIGPHMVRLRGVDGFWNGAVLDTGQVPRPVLLGLLGKVDQRNQNERLRVGRFLIQAGWYDEARAELDRLGRDFPELVERMQLVRQTVQQLEAEQVLREVETRRQARQPREVLSRLRTFPTEGVDPDLLARVRDQLREAEAVEAADRALGAEIQGLAGQIPEESRGDWMGPVIEVLAALAEAPDAVRDRLDAYRKADPSTEPGPRLALALTGWVVGPESAVADLGAAEALWKARGLVAEFLGEPDESIRSDRLATLRAIAWTDASGASRVMDAETVTKLARLLGPVRHDDAPSPGGPPTICRVADAGAEPLEYAVLLPPEYHHLRRYPAVVALHSGRGETSADRIRGAAAWWAEEAARRGYIVIAPEYNLPGEPPDYRYKPGEHAAAELALRDAKRRFAIDGDRVFLGGQLLGGNMAWDYGLAHPDLFAGLAIVSGLPAKYVDRYRGHAERLPIYAVLGDMAPGAEEIVLPLARSLMAKAYDVTYVEYARRGLEDLPEEAPAIFDWMDRHGPRETYPKKFEAASARPCDDRFYGLVIREFNPGRTAAPEAVDPLGKNLKPATLDFQVSAVSNLIRINVDGVRKLDIWVGPDLIDFGRRVEVRVNGKTFAKGQVRPDLGAYLEDLRVRGDREQVYWLKIPLG